MPIRQWKISKHCRFLQLAKCSHLYIFLYFLFFPAALICGNDYKAVHGCGCYKLTGTYKVGWDSAGTCITNSAYPAYPVYIGTEAENEMLLDHLTTWQLEKGIVNRILIAPRLSKRELTPLYSNMSQRETHCKRFRWSTMSICQVILIPYKYHRILENGVHFMLSSRRERISGPYQMFQMAL